MAPRVPQRRVIHDFGGHLVVATVGTLICMALATGIAAALLAWAGAL